MGAPKPVFLPPCTGALQKEKTELEVGKYYINVGQVCKIVKAYCDLSAPDAQGTGSAVFVLLEENAGVVNYKYREDLKHYMP